MLMTRYYKIVLLTSVRGKTSNNKNINRIYRSTDFYADYFIWATFKGKNNNVNMLCHVFDIIM